MKGFTLSHLQRLTLFLVSILEILNSFVWAQLNYRSGKPGEQVTSILNTVLNGYDKRVRPSLGVHPVDVGITMYVLSVDSISEPSMEFTMTFYFRQKWRDPRLKFTGYPNSIQVFGNELSDKIWIPDSFFVNQKSILASDAFTRLSPEGDVLRAVKLRVTGSCPMDLRYFPMDRQLCPLEIESFSSSMSDIRYNWASGTESVGVSPDVSLPQWKVLGTMIKTLEVSLTAGNYSRLNVDIQFARATGYYIVSVYLPAAILVVLSWIPFWINNEAMTARILTGVGSVVILLQMWQSTSAVLPKISYVKAIDVYLVSCIAIVLLSLIEHALITCLITRRKNYKKSMQNDVSRSGGRRKPCCLRMAPLLLDWFSRLAFPGLFVGFNFLYWKYCLMLTNSDVKDFIPIPSPSNN